MNRSSSAEVTVAVSLLGKTKGQKEHLAGLSSEGTLRFNSRNSPLGRPQGYREPKCARVCSVREVSGSL